MSRYDNVLSFTLEDEREPVPLAPMPSPDPRFGQAGVRDPDAPCEAYDPTENAGYLGLTITAKGDGDCNSDGHYLCHDCKRLSNARVQEIATWAREDDERRIYLAVFPTKDDRMLV